MNDVVFNKAFDELKKEYNNVPIPNGLDFVVKKALKEGKKGRKYPKNTGILVLRIAAASAALFILLITGANTSRSFAETIQQVPVIGSMIRVFTFREYNVSEDNYDAGIRVPQLEGMDNIELQDTLNEKYLEENKKLYEEFMAQIKELKEVGEGHLAVNSGYEVITDNGTIFSIKRYIEQTQASSYVENRYDTVDKKNQVLITLPSLFQEDDYIEVISSEIKKQMAEQLEADPGKIYWLDDGNTIPEDVFEKIDRQQSFYINSENKLVICFDEYEVAPGYMGNPEFVIPTEVVERLLVSGEYLK